MVIGVSPVVFDEPSGYYGPAVLTLDDGTRLQVMAELHVQAEPREHAPDFLTWNGRVRSDVEHQNLMAAYRREAKLELPGGRIGEVYAAESVLAAGEPLYLRLVGIGPDPFRKAA
jgi:hypothetical protein